MKVHVEIVKKHQVLVKRALKKVLATENLEDRYKIELKLMPQMRYDSDMK